jgi:ABC-type transporter Mla subunit MlaD
VSDIHFHFHFENPGVLPAIEQLKEQLTMNQAELATALAGIGTALTGVGTQLEKATNEIVVAISNAGVTSPAVDAAVANLQAVSTALATAAQTLDDLNPDAPPVA